MHPTPKFAPLLLLSALSLTACATSQPAQVISQIVYPALPDTTCKPNPTPPADFTSDKAIADYTRERFDAGDDCRDKLAAVHSVVDGWTQKTQGPAPPTPDDWWTRFKARLNTTSK